MGMAPLDFVIRVDPSVDTLAEISERAVVNIFDRRLKSKKPIVMFIGGDSGEGKTMAGLKIQEIRYRALKINMLDNLEHSNVFIPTEYCKKINELLFNKDLKDIDMIALHEAREIIRAKKWHEFLNQAIGDINAMSRSVKRLCIIIISQFIRDISTDIRYTLTYYCKAYRPYGESTRLYIWRMWKDDYDLEKPKLRKVRLRGRLVYPDGTRKIWRPTYIELNMPNREVARKADQLDTLAKSKILKRKLEKVMKEIQKEAGEETQSVSAMVDYYSANPDLLSSIGKHNKKFGWRLNKKGMEMHGLSKDEGNEFSLAINQKIKELGQLQETEEDGF